MAVLSYTKVRNLVKQTDNLIDLDFGNLQSWGAMVDWPIGESRKIGNTINTKVFQSNNQMRFITQIPPLEEFPKHWHDCAEICKILAGQMGDKLTDRVWSMNEEAIFSRGEKHTPWNPLTDVTLFMTVDFYF